MANTKLAVCCLLGVLFQLGLCAAHPNNEALLSCCTSVGQLVCNWNCTEVQLCMGDGTTGFVVETVESCTEETSCFLPERGCSRHGSSCKEGDFKFRCTAVGFFPDPYDCARFYVCVHSDDEGAWPGGFVVDGGFLLDEEDDDASGFEVFHEACEGGVAYDAGRQVCALPMTSRPCAEGPVPRCVALGQDGRLVENPSIYYVCHREDDWLFPVLYICPQEGVYNEVTKQCDARR